MRFGTFYLIAIFALVGFCLAMTSCSSQEKEITISGKVAVVYTNGEKDTIQLNEKFTSTTDTSEIYVYQTLNDGTSCLVVGSVWGYVPKACGVRKIQILNLKKTMKEL